VEEGLVEEGEGDVDAIVARPAGDGLQHNLVGIIGQVEVGMDVCE
jgi:hypothetical protein